MNTVEYLLRAAELLLTADRVSDLKKRLQEKYEKAQEKAFDEKDAFVRVAASSAVQARIEELVKEYGEEPESALEYWLEDNENEIDEVTLMALIQMTGAEWHGGPMPTGVTLVRVGDHVFEAPKGSKEFEDQGDFDNFITNVRMSDRFNEYYGPIDEKFNEEFWDYPPPLLHGTNDLEAVMEEGLLPSSETRGIGNRSVGSAVFTTTNDDVAAEYGSADGGGIVEIDTQAMKKDNYTPFVSEEPPIVEYEYSTALGSHLGMDMYEPDLESGIDRDTVIVYGEIPAKYLKVV